MSHIDTINHSHIGWLSNIPVYHPLEKDKFYDFDEKSIVLGGGSGEHPIFVIYNMNACLKYYIYVMTSDFNYYDDDFEYRSFWSIENAYNFQKSVKKELKRLDLYAEKYIATCVGEFLARHGEVFVEKGLIEKTILIKAKEVEKETKRKADGIKLVDSGKKDDKWGKIIKDGKVVWGYSYIDEFNDYKNNKQKPVKLILPKRVIKELSENSNQKTADQLSREMSERARKILNGEPVESCAMKINCY